MPRYGSPYRVSRGHNMPVTSINQANTVPVATGTPGSSAVGDSASAGTATTMSRSDHVHGREAFATTPSTQAIGDAAAAGTATTVTRGDHKHAMPSFGTPVTVNGQTTSLSAGSLTTVARADHVHTITNADVLLASTTLSSTTASITFSSLSGTWPILKLVGTYRVTEWSAGQALTEVWLRLNTDTGSNYIDGYTSSNSATYTTLGPVNTNSNFNASGAPLITHICNADSTSSPTRYKIIHTNGNYNSSTTAISSGFVGGWPSVWKSTAAVTSVTLITFSSFLSGTHVRLYGLS